MAQTKIKLIADGVIDENHLKVGHTITTDNIGEGTNLYYTDARVGSYLSTNSYATEGYVTTAVANLVDAAPSTLDTLNELAAALGDDPNFATTVTNSIATKLPLAGGTISGNLTVSGLFTGTDILSSAAAYTIGTISDSNIEIGTSAAGTPRMLFRVNGNNERMRIDANGNVGIGTSSPLSGYKLTIQSGNTTQAAFWNNTASNADVGTQLVLLGGAGNFLGGISAHYVSGDPANGSYFKISNRNTSGAETERLRIDSSGRVGIGTTGPSFPLHIATVGSDAVSLYLSGDVSGNSAIKGGGGNLDIWSPGGDVTLRYNNASDVKTIGLILKDSSGNVGIGTSSPRLSLEVIGTDAAESGTATPNGAIMVGNPIAANSQFLTIGTVNGVGNYSWIQSRNSTQALFYNLALNPSGGNVGIGTSSPATLLEIAANNTGVTTTNAAKNKLRLSDTDTVSTGGQPVGAIEFYSADTSDAGVNSRISGVCIFGGNNAGALTFETGVPSNLQESMRITDGGNVGIGTSSPTRQFEVSKAGTAYIRAADTTNSVNVDMLAASSGGWIGTQSSHPFMLQTANTERVRIDSSGLVQIGDGASTSSLKMISGTSDYFQIDSTGTITNLIAGNSSTGSAEMAFYTSSGGTESERMRITSGGNVAIGTSSAGYRLSVENSASAIFYGQTDATSGSMFRLRSNGGASTVLDADANGNFLVTGALSKGSGSFKIDHPLRPDTHHLVHSFVESPQANNIYRGKVQLIDGKATVNLDEVSTMSEGTFAALNRDIHTYTSNESDWDAVRGNVEGNILTIECQNPQSTAIVSWLVIGERQDKHMFDTEWTDENGKVIVEPLKEENGIN